MDLILFDGDCNVCNRSVQFVLKRDTKRRFRFASLQSAVARRALEERGVTGEVPDSMILITEGRVWLRSGAVLRIARGLRFPWPVLSVFLLVPAPIRDWFYKRFAERRYRWFGRAEHCLVPTPEVRARFLDADERG
ncbi:MAG: DCC1-like thiol-disulfide oxidoreductase family protein [bacterium]|nr:DCC1-like thiol-disulfide oxidoreductase family protein [bacterium]